MALKDHTVDELIEELRGRTDVFSVQMWLRDDVEQCFPEKDEAEVTEFMEVNGSYFDDRCTELGWEVMGDLD